MQDGVTSVAAKIRDVQAAHSSGALADHALMKTLTQADAKVPSSWGPAMRR